MNHDELSQDDKIKWAHEEILLPTKVPEYIGKFAYSYLEALREIAQQLKRVADEQTAEVEPIVITRTFNWWERIKYQFKQWRNK